MTTTVCRAKALAVPLLPLLVCAALWLGLVYELSAQWSVYPQYHYGWAVPVLCGWLLKRRWDQLPPARVIPNQRRNRGALLVLAAAALAYAPTRWLHEANPVWRLTSFLLAAEVITTTLCTLSVLYGPEGLRRSVWPLGFFLVAVPWPSPVESQVVQRLAHLNASVAVETLGICGVPALPYGNTIETAAGWVGINEACSGVQSLQATLMLSVFLGEFYRLRWFGRGACVLLGGVAAIVGNACRTTVLAFVATRQGLPALEQWHDPTGLVILTASLLLLWWSASSFAAREKAWDLPSGDASGDERLSPGLKFSGASATGLALALGYWVCLVEAGTQGWYWFHERKAAAHVDWRPAKQPGLPGFRRVELPQEVLSQFGADEAVEARWQAPSGIAGQLFYFRWLPSPSLQRRVWTQLAKTHRPESCLGALGMQLLGEEQVQNFQVRELTLALRHYVFQSESGLIDVFYGCYEDAGGTERFAPVRDDVAGRLAAAMAGSRNCGQRWLEIAFWGARDRAEARAAAEELLPRLIETRSRPALNRAPLMNTMSASNEAASLANYHPGLVVRGRVQRRAGLPPDAAAYRRTDALGEL